MLEENPDIFDYDKFASQQLNTDKTKQRLQRIRTDVNEQQQRHGLFVRKD